MNSELTISHPESLVESKPVTGWMKKKATPGGVVFKYTLQYLAIAGLALGCYILISHFVLQSVQVVGGSMHPTLRDADRYFLNRLTYYLHPPRHSDIVVIKDPSDGIFVVKRIVATPGEAVYLKDGKIYVNGRALKEPYLKAGTPTLTCSEVEEQLILCGKDQYFVLGDNRGNSLDSRMYGPVRRQNILGVVMR
jgi:signal peptidase I